MDEVRTVFVEAREEAKVRISTARRVAQKLSPMMKERAAISETNKPLTERITNLEKELKYVKERLTLIESSVVITGRTFVCQGNLEKEINYSEFI